VVCTLPHTVPTYGVRPRETCTSRDQLGLVLTPPSKIEDGSDLGTLCGHVTAVGDFQWLPSFELHLVPEFRPFRAPALSMAPAMREA
jgi:hypothetical protein